MGLPYSWKEIYVLSTLLFLLHFVLYLRAISKYKPPWTYIQRDNNCVLSLGGGRLIFGGAYFRNFMISCFVVLNLQWHFLF